ncbi:MAG: hypothetical protein LBE13_17635, partial [Bacteroidales bacterium]|nr:hypothetical protein [Bacteroidales bacterium]
MNKYKWSFERWKLFQHPKEEIYRIKQQIQYRIIDRYWVKHLPVEKHFEFCNPFKHKYSLDGLRRVIPELLDNYHAFKILNVTMPDIISHSKWNYDIKNRIDGNSSFAHKINDFDYSNGEIKYIYELSRLYHLPQLGAFAVVSKQDELLHIIFRQIQDWYKDNQFLKTIAWKSGNVVGIRVINLILFRILIDLGNYQRGDLLSFTSLFDSLVELHFKFLISHLSLYSSKGNHYLGEIAGIIAICSVYKFKNSNKHLKKFFLELCSELLRLIHEDGFNREQSTRYQASYINLFITACQFARERGYVLPEVAQDRVRTMYAFLAELRINDKQFFMLGDDDAAQLIYPYADTDYNIYESMLNDLEILYDIKTVREYHFDLRNYLLFGDDGYGLYLKSKRLAKKTEKNDIKIGIYENSGYFLIKNRNINFLFDVGPIGLQPGM